MLVEEEVREQQIKIEQNQSRLYSGKVTNPKELQDLQAEAEAFKRQLSLHENRQLEKMMALEERQSLESEAGKALHVVQVYRENEHGDLSKEQAILLEEKNRSSEIFT